MGAFSFMKSICQTTPLLRKPLLNKCMLVFTIQFCALLGWAFWNYIFSNYSQHFLFYLIYSLNTVRLWLPQLFSMVSDFENMETFDDTDSDLCSMLSYSVNKSIANIQSIDTNNTCVVVSIFPIKIEWFDCSKIQRGEQTNNGGTSYSCNYFLRVTFWTIHAKEG